MTKVITKIADIFTFVLLTGALLVNILKFSEYFLGGSKKWFAVAALAAAVFAFYALGGSIFAAIKKVFSFVKKLSVVQMAVILFAFILASKVFLVFLLDNNFTNHTDMRHYYSFATQIADSGKITEETLYASLYGYSVVYGWFLAPIAKVFGSDTKVFTVFLSVLFAVTSVLLFDIARKYIGKNKAFFGVFLYNILPVGLFQTQVLIHETALLFFYVLSFRIFLKALGTEAPLPKRIGLLVLSALIIAFGSQINIGGAVVIISFLIYALADAAKNRLTLKKLLNVAVCAVCFALCFVIVLLSCMALVKNTVQVPESEKALVERSVNNRVSMAWVTYLGMNYETGGVWNEEDAKTYDHYFQIEDSKQAKDYQNALVEERMKSYTDNPMLVPKLMWHKYFEMWSVPFLGIVYGKGGNHINDVLLYAGNRAIYKGILALCYLSNILIYSAFLFSYFRKRKKELPVQVTPELQFKLLFVGIVLALILFEIVNKYVSHLHFVLFMLALFRAEDFIESSRGFGARLKRK